MYFERNPHPSINPTLARHLKLDMQVAFNAESTDIMAPYPQQNAFNPSSGVQPPPRTTNMVPPSSQFVPPNFEVLQRQQIPHGAPPRAFCPQEIPPEAGIPQAIQRQRFNMQFNPALQHMQAVDLHGSRPEIMQQQMSGNQHPRLPMLPPFVPPDLEILQRLQRSQNHPELMAQYSTRSVRMPQPGASIQQPCLSPMSKPRFIMSPPHLPNNFEATQRMPLPCGCRPDLPASLPYLPQMQQPGHNTHWSCLPSSSPPPPPKYQHDSISGNRPGVPLTMATSASISKPTTSIRHAGVPVIPPNLEPLRLPAIICRASTPGNNNGQAGVPVFPPSLDDIRPLSTPGDAAIPRGNKQHAGAQVIPPVSRDIRPPPTHGSVPMTGNSTRQACATEIPPILDFQPPPTPGGARMPTGNERQTSVPVMPPKFDDIRPPPTPCRVPSTRNSTRQAGAPEIPPNFDDIWPPPTSGGVRMPAGKQQDSVPIIPSNFDYMRPPPTPCNPFQGDRQSVMPGLANESALLPQPKMGTQPNRALSTSNSKNITSFPPPSPQVQRDSIGHAVSGNGSQWMPTARIGNTYPPTNGIAPYMSNASMISPAEKVGTFPYPQTPGGVFLRTGGSQRTLSEPKPTNNGRQMSPPPMGFSPPTTTRKRVRRAQNPELLQCPRTPASLPQDRPSSSNQPNVMSPPTVRSADPMLGLQRLQVPQETCNRVISSKNQAFSLPPTPLPPPSPLDVVDVRKRQKAVRLPPGELSVIPFTPHLRQREGSQENSLFLTPHSNRSSLSQPLCRSTASSKADSDQRGNNSELPSPDCHPKPASTVSTASQESTDTGTAGIKIKKQTRRKRRISKESEGRKKRGTKKRESAAVAAVATTTTTTTKLSPQPEKEEVTETDPKELDELMELLDCEIPQDLIDFAAEMDLNSLKIIESQKCEKEEEEVVVALQEEKEEEEEEEEEEEPIIKKECLPNLCISDGQDKGTNFPSIEQYVRPMYTAPVARELGFVPPQVYKSEKILASSTVRVSELARIHQHLRMLLHGMDCWRLIGYSKCPKAIETCMTARSIIQHMQRCPITTAYCSFPLCTSSRQLVSHWKNCSLREQCQICAGILFDRELLKGSLHSPRQ